MVGRNMLHGERPGVAEDIEDSGLKLDCGSAQGSGILVGVVAGHAGKRIEGVRAVREAEDDVAVAGRDVCIDWT
jgi:hypothetical protein